MGIASVAIVVRRLLDNGYDLKTIMSWLSKIEMNLNKHPWSGLLWEPGTKRMINLKKNRTIATKILLYWSGVKLSLFKLDKKSLKREYASSLNKEEKDTHLPKIINI